MEAAEYRRIVDDAIEALPPKLLEQMKDVVVVIEERPQRGYRRRLLGLYEGVPITEWGKGGAIAELPDQITLFTRTIEAVAKTEEEIPHVVRETLWHEIAHHFGFDHDAMHEMEERWKSKRQEGKKS
jgi:predicted Zn-dependent protease with MMP-like domain